MLINILLILTHQTEPPKHHHYNIQFGYRNSSKTTNDLINIEIIRKFSVFHSQNIQKIIAKEVDTPLNTNQIIKKIIENIFLHFSNTDISYDNKIAMIFLYHSKINYMVKIKEYNETYIKHKFTKDILKNLFIENNVTIWIFEFFFCKIIYDSLSNDTKHIVIVYFKQVSWYYLYYEKLYVNLDIDKGLFLGPSEIIFSADDILRVFQNVYRKIGCELCRITMFFDYNFIEMFLNFMEGNVIDYERIKDKLENTYNLNVNIENKIIKLIKRIKRKNVIIHPLFILNHDVDYLNFCINYLSKVPFTGNMVVDIEQVTEIHDLFVSKVVYILELFKNKRLETNISEKLKDGVIAKRNEKDLERIIIEKHIKYLLKKNHCD